MSASPEKRQRFINVFADIRDELIQHFANEGMPDDGQEWFRRSLDHNVIGGKLTRGLSVIDTVEILLGHALSEDEYRRVATLGYTIELLQAALLVADDIMDRSVTRRGRPCWYTISSVGSIAVNDAFMLEQAAFYVLRSHFRNEPYYADVVDLLLETKYNTDAGQLVDCISEGSTDLSAFSLNKHCFLSKFKTMFYSFYCPVLLSLNYVSTSIPGIATPEVFAKVKEIFIPFGEYYQVQDDYVDCYYTPEQMGKIGTDIVDGKCSWLIVTALTHANSEQRRVLEECYGRKDAEKEKRVKEIYDELDLRGKYAKYERDTTELVTSLINSLPKDGPLKPEVFTRFYEKIFKIYDRTKY